MTFHENVLVVEIHDAENWKEAFFMHSKASVNKDDDWYEEWFNSIPNDLEEAKNELFNSDILIDVKEV